MKSAHCQNMTCSGKRVSSFQIFVKVRLIAKSQSRQHGKFVVVYSFFL